MAAHYVRGKQGRGWEWRLGTIYVENTHLLVSQCSRIISLVR